MRKIKIFLVALGMALGTLPIASPAHAVVCHDYPGGCCGEVTVAGKTIIRIDCQN
jgi:hypothetical protein